MTDLGHRAFCREGLVADIRNQKSDTVYEEPVTRANGGEACG